MLYSSGANSNEFTQSYFTLQRYSKYLDNG